MNRKLIVSGLAVAVVAALVLPSMAASAADDPRIAQAQANVSAYCTALVDDATTTRQRNTRNDLCTMWTRELADLTPVTPTPTPTVTRPPVTTPAPTTRPPVTTTPPVTTVPPTTAPPTPTPTTPPSVEWPNANNTGVPSFVTLTNYTGPCTINTPNVTIDSKSINCGQVKITSLAVNTVIKNSKITAGGGGNAAVIVEGSLTLTDSEVFTGVSSSGVDGSNINVLRADIHGGNRGMWCSHCTVKDSYIHGGRAVEPDHASGLRADQYSTFIHNYIVCDIPGGLCSADLTGYPDYNVQIHWTITNNYFGPNSVWFCAYGGATKGKDFSDRSDNATYIQFRDNVFARGASGHCATPGAPGTPEFSQGVPLSDYDKSKAGWVWSNNRYEDGVLINV